MWIPNVHNTYIVDRMFPYLLLCFVTCRCFPSAMARIQLKVILRVSGRSPIFKCTRIYICIRSNRNRSWARSYTDCIHCTKIKRASAPYVPLMPLSSFTPAPVPVCYPNPPDSRFSKHQLANAMPSFEMSRCEAHGGVPNRIKRENECINVSPSNRDELCWYRAPFQR